MLDCMSGRSKTSLAVAGTLALAGLAALPMGAAGAASCTSAKNVELINDDSGSMSSTDPNRNRVEAAKLLLSKAANRGGTTYGAVEFAKEASPIFGPTKVTSANLASLSNTITARTLDDGSGAPLAEDPSRTDTGGGTDYNAAFTVGNQSNAGADARVFLTDGGHNEDNYNDVHKNPVKKTYVVGFGGITAGTPDEQRLQAIANDTGGQYFPVTDSGQLTGVVNTIDDKLSCAAATKTFADAFSRQGQTKLHSLKTSTSTRSLEFTILWQGAQNAFDIANLTVQSGKQVVAVGSRKRRKRSRLKVTRKRGSTFLTVRVRGKGLRRGHRVRFRLKAKVLTVPTFVGTSVAQSKRR
jgi:hypothetical protein